MKIKKFGPYQTEELLGRGGMGTVYRGIHEETRQEVALKVLSFIHADDDNFRERFTLEIETLKKLRHPNIVELYGYGVQDGHLFYAMEFIQGCSLQQELNSGRRYDWREATKMAIVICQALKHAHDRGVIHRDLKPANLLIDQDNQIKLSDFGIAKLFGAHQITADRTVIGTADYMAPEQAEGVSASVKSDLYSLGSVMYALVTGKPPFAATTLAQVLNDLRHATPFPLTRQVPQIPAEFDKTVIHLLQKEPEKRFATALALANHLRAMEHGLKGKATSPQETPPKSAQTKIDTHVSEQPVSPEEDLQSDDTRALRPTVEAPQYSQGAAAATQESLSGEIRNPTLADTETDHTSEEKVDQFTKVDPNRSFSEDQGTEKEALLITVSKVGLTLVLIILLIGAGWYMLKPASESQLYDQIQSAAQQDPPV
ncbi:MAG TPA: serine/threonine protein kinase, partial [Planctomycetaceae bacterium]|nr:serine/threonine protein kinase [Planctomycetaceae bacterium]